MMEQTLLTLENLSKYYVNGRSVVTGLNKINLTFSRGEFVAITGESGSGKSTLAHILSGILPYEDGELLIEGKPTSHYDSADWEHYRRDNVAFISQSYGILPGATVQENVVSALRLTGMEKSLAREETKKILEEVELWEYRSRRAAKLSSGQKQRLSIARALAKPCSILIADEPTGNLDPENSDKVIRLLARAAQDRLVFLITHEFPEAEDYVTRRISLQDGVISGDDRMKPAKEVRQKSAPRSPAKKLGLYTAGLQMRSRPVWTTLVLLFFLLTAFSVFAFLGTFIVAVDDTSTRIYDNAAFMNGAQDRIVAVRKDFQPLTQEDYETILSLKYVEKLERFGYIADINYAYQPEVDYIFHYTVENYGSNENPMYMQVETVEVLSTDQYARTIPVSRDSESFLTEGRLPENIYEVVAGDEALLGQTVTVYIKDIKNWGTSEYVKIDAEVVGTAAEGDGLYFHEDMAKTLTLNYLGIGDILMPWYEDVPSDVTFVDYVSASARSMAALTGSIPNPFYTECVPTEESVQRPLGENETLVSFPIYRTLRYNNIKYGKEWKYPAGNDMLDVKGIHESTLINLIYVAPERYRAWVDAGMEGCGDQVSITIQDYAYTERVVTALEKAGYYALSPYVLGSAKVDDELAVQRIQTLAICLGALIAVLALQMIVLRALFGMEFEAYRLLSNIGLTWKNAVSSVMLQILEFTVVGQLLGFGAILLCAQSGIVQIVNLTKYLEGVYWILLSGVHLAAALLAGLMVIRSLKKQVYPLSARRTDLAPRSKEAAK